MTEPLPIVRGSDHTVSVTWNDSNGDPVDMTGRELTFFDISPKLQDRLEGEIFGDPTLGKLLVRIEGNPPLPLGLYSFRLMLTTPGADSIATKMIYVKVE